MDEPSNIVAVGSGTLDPSDLESLRAHIAGELLEPRSAAYDAARRVWNGRAPTRSRRLVVPIPRSASHAGALPLAQREIEPLRHLGPVAHEDLRPRPFVEWQSFLDAARPAGRGCSMRSHFLRTLEDGFLGALVAAFERAPSKLSVAIVEHCHGAIARVAPDATAFAPRTSPVHFEVIAFWEDATEALANVAWSEDALAATSPYSSREVYVNSLDVGESRRVPEAYGANLRRLRDLKRQRDPRNFFRCNHNIAPATGAPSPPRTSG